MPSSNEANSSSRPVILVVDDHESSRYTRSKSLRRAGFEVLEAGTGRAALEIVAKERPSLVILDIHLPDIDGFDVCRQIKADPATSVIPVLHMSATQVGAPDQVRGLEGGADGYLVEPVVPDVMVATVRALLRVRNAEDELRKSRRSLTALMSNLPGAAYRCSVMGDKLSFVSDRCLELTGYSAADLLSRERGWWDFVHPEDVAMANALAASANRSATPVELTYRIQGRDGSERWLWDRATPVPGDFGGLVWEGFATDITERKRVQAERDALLASEHAARAEAERASRLKDDFLATLSHELRTPLNAVLGWTHILGKDSRSPEILAQGLAVIDRNARMQAQLIGDLLDMNRIISGKMRLDVQRVELAVVIEAALDSVRPAAEAKNVQIRSVLEPIANHVQGDPARLQQIVWNLVSNSVKFTDRGGSVQVALARVDSHIEISVKDSGRGIRPEFLPHVFERFRQADSSTAREHGGLGLGLAIVKQLVDLHGGSVAASSDGPGKGSTFTVRLPLGIVSVPQSQPSSEVLPALHRSEPSVAAQAQAAPSLNGIRVFVLDDEVDACEVVRRLLEEHGAEVEVSNSADAALRVLEKRSFDVILSDIGMPGADGYSFIQAVRGRGIDTPAATLTAFARTEDRTRALLAGYQTHMAKPVEPTELIATVAALSRDRAKRVP
jgi:PAS domain S-box-containing protein